MTDLPHILLSCAMSLDGYIDDTTDRRLLLSNDADFDRVDEVRSRVDAIMIGANTIRADNPRLLVRSPERRAQRVSRGLAPSPLKITVAGRSGLDPAAQFFTEGDVEKLVYCSSRRYEETRAALGHIATVVEGGDPVEVRDISQDLASRGVKRLMVEGGSSLHTQFLTAGLVDELHLVIAPFFVGDTAAPRFVGPGAFPWNRDHRADLVDTQQIGDVALLRYRFDRVDR